MKGDKLTPKQEKFINMLIEGKSQREAYRLAYDNYKLTDKSIDEMASKLFNNIKILSRYKELQQECASKSVWTRQKAENDLLKIKDLCVNAMIQIATDKDTGADITVVDSKVANVAINALKELNSMCGFNLTNSNTNLTGEVSIVNIVDDI